MKKLPIKNKIFITNFFQFILIFLFVTLAFGYANSEVGVRSIGFLGGYIVTSACCVLYLGVKIGDKFYKYEEINEKTCEFLEKEKITIQEFRKKYRDIIGIYDRSVYMFNDIETEEKKIETYEFTRYGGEKVKITIGYSDAEKADIYWDDIVAAKNNSYDDLCDENGTQWLDSNYDPEGALDLVNKVCPKCGGAVDRFYFYSNKKREDQDAAWMEVCFKCKKILYFDVDFKD